MLSCLVQWSGDDKTVTMGGGVVAIVGGDEEITNTEAVGRGGAGGGIDDWGGAGADGVWGGGSAGVGGVAVCVSLVLNTLAKVPGLAGVPSGCVFWFCSAARDE